MANTTTLNETTRSPLDGTEYIRLATTGNNWKAQTGTSTWMLGGAVISSAGTPITNQFTDLFEAHATSGAVIAGLASWNASVETILDIFRGVSGTIGTYTTVASGNILGDIRFRGADGTTSTISSMIRSTVDAAVSSGIVPGRLSLHTANSSGTNTEAVRIDSSQRVTIGGVANQSGTQVEIDNTGATLANCAAIQWSSTSVNQPGFNLARSKSSTIGTQSAVAVNDPYGSHNWYGSDGTSFVKSIQVTGECDGTVATNQVPGRLRFYTANSSGTLTEAVRIDSSQRVTIGGVANQGSNMLEVDGTTSGTSSQGILCWNSTAGNANTGNLTFVRSRNATIGSHTAVAANDGLGFIIFRGDDGTSSPQSIQIIGECDGTVGTGQVPGRLRFLTANSAGTLTECFRIDSKQQIVSNILPNSTTSNFNYTGQTGVSVTNGSNAAICPGFRGLIYISNETGSGTGSGDSALYIVSTAGTAGTGFISCGGGSGTWVAPTTTPAAGHSSVSGGNPWNVYNNVGNTATFKVVAIQLV